MRYTRQKVTRVAYFAVVYWALQNLNLTIWYMTSAARLWHEAKTSHLTLRHLMTHLSLPAVPKVLRALLTHPPVQVTV